jgi:hypothetical protein
MKRLPIMEEVVNKHSQRICDKLVKKLKEEGNTEALELFNEYKDDKKRFHDFMQGFANMIMGYVQKYGGDEVVWNNMQDYARYGYPPFINKYIEALEKGKASPEDFPLGEFLINRAKVWEKNHDNLMKWEEDDEKITLTLDPCESGGQVVREIPPEKVAVTGEAQYWCYNKKGFPIYCLNCTTMWEFGWYDWFGWPIIIFETPEIGSKGKCVHVIYKDPRKIPDSYYKKRGIKRKV